MTQSFYVVVVVTYAVFVVSTIPGVRPHAGYNLFLDGLLNNIAYVLSAVVCLVRARSAGAYRAAGGSWPSGLALYGAGNIYWTIFIRHAGPGAVPVVRRRAVAVVLPLRVRRAAADRPRDRRRLPLSLWLDGVVGGLAVAAVAAAIRRAGPRGHRRQLRRGRHDAGLPAARRAAAAGRHGAVLALFHWRPPVGLWLLVGGLALVRGRRRRSTCSPPATAPTSPAGSNDAVWVLATLLIGFAPGWSERPPGVPLPAGCCWASRSARPCARSPLLVYDHEHTLHPVAVALCAGDRRGRAGPAHRDLPRGHARWPTATSWP